MGDRNRFVGRRRGAAAIARAAATRARRLARTSGTTTQTSQAGTAPADEEPSTAARLIPDEAHAVGHSHVHPAETTLHEPEPTPVFERPFSKRAHGLRYPGRR